MACIGYYLSINNQDANILFCFLSTLKANQICSLLPLTLTLAHTRYIKIKVEHYLLFMFSPPKISLTVWGINYIYFHIFTVFYLIQPSRKQIICFDFWKQNSVLPKVFYVPWVHIFFSHPNTRRSQTGFSAFKEQTFREREKFFRNWISNFSDG